MVSPIQDIPPVSTTTAIGIRAAGAAVDPGKSTAADSRATAAATAELSKWHRDCFDVLCRYAQRAFLIVIIIYFFSIDSIQTVILIQSGLGTALLFLV